MHKIVQFETKQTRRNPWLFIPTQYFAEGLPYVIVNNLSVVMYKSLGISNDLIGYTSLLYLPWALKPLWSPIIDGTSTKRNWLLAMQLIIAVLFFLSSLALFSDSFFIISIILFTLISFTSATHDIATDGFYLHALNQKEQAFFTGIRSTFYRISMIFGSGFLVIIAGELGSKFVAKGWAQTLAISSALFIIIFVYHLKLLPYPATDKAVYDSESSRTQFFIKNKIPFFKAFSQYFTQEKILLIIAFILLYRLGEGLLVKMAQPFFLDPINKGGLGLSISDVGMMYGTIGVIALLSGGILGGWLIKKYGLKKLIFPLALCMNIPNLLYVYMALFKPTFTIILNFSLINQSLSLHIYPLIVLCIIIEQFGYGLGFTAFMVYMLYTSKGEFRTSHYAISTGFMAVGMMLPGFISGFLQIHIGYLWLFILSFIFTIPGMLLIFYLPYREE